MRTILAIVLVGTAASTSHARNHEPVTVKDHGAVQRHDAVDGPVRQTRTSAQLVVEGPEGDVVLESTTADVCEVGDTALVKLSIVLASQRDGATGRAVLRVPFGARVVEMAYSQGGAQVVAVSQPAEDARLQFEAAEHGVVDWRTVGRRSEVRVQRIIDPALLEWTSAERDQQSYRFSVFPMSSFERTTAVVSIVMPRFDQLAIVMPVSQVKPSFAGDRGLVLDARAFRAPTDADVALAARSSAVERSTSLYAAPLELPVAHPALHDSILRTSSRLRACFKGRPHDVVVHLTIGDHGNVIAPEVTGGSPQLKTCLAMVAQTWRYRGRLATKGALAYPLHFTPATGW